MQLEKVQILQHLILGEGGSPKGEDEGFNAAVMRTKKGIKVFNEAVESGYLVKGDKVTIDDIKDFQPHQTTVKNKQFMQDILE